MLFAQLSTIFEPYAFNRQIIGFDTFAGFPHVDAKDGERAVVGDLGDADWDLLHECIEVFDLNRPLGHVPKVILVKGDAVQTIPRFVSDNPHLIVALLYLDLDLYSPTKVAIETFLPRMPKGAIVAFDELNEKRWQGETIAVLESLNLRDLKVEKFPEEPHVSFAQF